MVLLVCSNMSDPPFKGKIVMRKIGVKLFDIHGAEVGDEGCTSVPWTLLHEWAKSFSVTAAGQAYRT